MTDAVCFKCGALKFGSFTQCPECAAVPRSEDELVISLAMTSHFLDRDALRNIGVSIRQRGEVPSLDNKTREVLLESVRKMSDLLPKG